MSADDIVARLRAQAQAQGHVWVDVMLVLLDGANEIERLREEVVRLKDGIREAHTVLKLTYEEMMK